MSVTLKLSDEDAKLIGKVLGEVGKAGVEARKLRLTPEELANAETGGGVRSVVENAMLRTNQAKVIGNAMLPALTRRHETPDELVRLGAAFDTAVFANEARR